jgi:hypothetical protein
MGSMATRKAKKSSVSNYRVGDYNLGSLETLASAAPPQIDDFLPERDNARAFAGYLSAQSGGGGC